MKDSSTLQDRTFSPTFNSADVTFSFGRWRRGIQCNDFIAFYLNACFLVADVRQFLQFVLVFSLRSRDGPVCKCV